LKRVEISPRRWLFLPVETIARELAAKTLLACFAAERGWGAVIGGYKGIIRKSPERLPRGAYIEKSVSPTRRIESLKLKAAGHRVSAWCEEGLIYSNGEAYRERRIDPDCFNLLDYFFAWGKQQTEDILPAIGGKGGNIILSGNPRFDLLRPEIRGIFYSGAEKIRQRFGRIILINTKFSTVNINKNIKNFNYVAYLRSVGKIKTDEQEDFWRRYIRINEGLFPYFKKLLPLLSAEFSGHTIVVRPHPAESHAPWVELAGHLPNVRVIFEGSVNEWLLAADVMIHSNCTTGVEAFLLERPAISYRPVKDESVEDRLPNELSLQTGSEEELLSLVRRITDGSGAVLPDERKNQEKFARQYIANLDGKLACEKIMDTIDLLDLPLHETAFPLPPEKLPLRKQLARQVKIAQKKVRQMSSGGGNIYVQQKFPGLRSVDVNKLLQEIRLATGRFDEITNIQVGEDAYCFYRP